MFKFDLPCSKRIAPSKTKTPKENLIRQIAQMKLEKERMLAADLRGQALTIQSRIDSLEGILGRIVEPARELAKPVLSSTIFQRRGTATTTKPALMPISSIRTIPVEKIVPGKGKYRLTKKAYVHPVSMKGITKPGITCEAKPLEELSR